MHGPSGVVLARSLPSSYNTSTAPLGVAFVVLLQRPDGVFDVVSHAYMYVCERGRVVGETGEVKRKLNDA